MYSSTLPSTSALDGGGWSTPRPGRFTPGKETRYPFYGRLSRRQVRSGRVRKISPPLGFDPRIVQSIASGNTVWAIPAHNMTNGLLIFKMHFVFLWLTDPLPAMVSPPRGFKITHSTLSRTPLDEWSDRRRDLYLITHNTRNRQTSTPRVGFEPAIPASERPQKDDLDRAATEIGIWNT